MTDHPSSVSWDAIERWLAGKSPDDEAARVRAIFVAHPEAAVLVQHYRDALSEGDPVVTPDDVSRLIARVQVHVQKEIISTRTAVGLGVRTLRKVLWSASSLAVAVLGYVSFTYRGQSDTTVTRAYATRSGQQATFTLTDGTRVTLAPQTTLRLVRFGASSRSVTLDGQAYFEVARTAGTPFRVHTGSVATQVLGTAFLVRHYESDTQVHVAVTEGKVSVVPDMPRRKTSASRFASRFASGLTLTAGQIGDVTDSTIVTSAVSVNDITRETDWLRGRLVFQHIPVSQVLQTLSRWYGYQFRCTDSSLTNQNVTVALDGRSSAAAFAMLEQLLEVSLTVTGDTVMLTPRRSRSTKGPAHKKEYDVWIPTREVGR